MEKALHFEKNLKPISIREKQQGEWNIDKLKGIVKERKEKSLLIHYTTRSRKSWSDTTARPQATGRCKTLPG